MAKTFVEELVIYIRAGYPIISIISSEEDRALELIEETMRHKEIAKRPRRLLIWSISHGMVDAEGKSVAKEETRRPEQALAFVAKYCEGAIFLFKDLHPYLKENVPNSSLIIRLLRDLIPDLKGSLRTLLWLSPTQQIPVELQKDVTVIDLPLPSESEYRRILYRLIAQVRHNPNVTIQLESEDSDAIAKACQGLTRSEAENALAKAIVSQHGLTGHDIKAILEEKEQIIRKSGILEYINTNADFNGIGGLNNLKIWLRQRNEGFSQKARDFGLPNPRGVMLVGVPGCGKSLCAKAVAAEWRKPLLKFDLGRVFAGLVGESEERMRRALSVAEGVAPCVLWIDELEKGLSGISGSGDSGVAARIFGSLLTWMEEKTQPVFVVATANDISRLPAELLRKGRLDEIFFVDLPNIDNRATILAIHLMRRRRTPANYDLLQLAQAAEGFSGAELEEMVISALYDAFTSHEQELNNAHLFTALHEIKPLAHTRDKEIAALRHWAIKNCRMAAINN